LNNQQTCTYIQTFRKFHKKKLKDGWLNIRQTNVKMYKSLTKCLMCSSDADRRRVRDRSGFEIVVREAGVDVFVEVSIIKIER
jgi:hypothetical protein